MLSKEGFCKALQMIKEQESIDEQFSKALDLVGDGHFVFGAENKYLLALRDVLKEAVNGQYDYIDWWLYGTVIDVKDYNLDKVEPDLWAIKGLAASLLPVIREFYTHEENVQAFEAWLKERENNSQKHSKRK